MRVKPRDSFDMGEDTILDNIIDSMPINYQILNENKYPNWVRFDVDEDDII